MWSQFNRLACFCLVCLIGTTTAVAVDEAQPSGVSVSEPNEIGLVTKMRPILPTIAVGDPVRFALHFETPEGPIAFGPVAKPKEGPDDKIQMAMQMIDRSATLKSMEIAIKSPGGKWQLKPLGEKELDARKTMFYSSPTFLLELGEETVLSLNANAQEEMAIPWATPWDTMIVPGEYQFAVRGKLCLETRERVIRRPGEPEKKIEASETVVAFQSKPISIKVERVDMTFQKLSELEEAAVNALKEEVADGDENLTVTGVESLPIADEDGNRVIRVRANMPPPPVGAIRIAGGQGYWQYEVVMTPAGKPVSMNRWRKGFCVVAGTRIATPEGLRKVETLAAGELVWAYDERSGSKVESPLLAVRSSQADATVVVNDRLQLTADHPVATQQESGKITYKPAALLTASDRLILADGSNEPAKKVQRIAGNVVVYDLSVAGQHNFFASGVLVHNKSIAWTPKAFVPWYSLWNRPKPK